MSYHGNDALEYANKEPLDIRPGSTQKVSENFDPKIESLKLENEVDQILQALRTSQESEYNIAQERLYAQKKYLQNLYEQLDKEKCELTRHTAYLDDPDALLQLVRNRVDQIKKELLKLKDMEEVAKGFGKTSKEILKEHFGLGM